LLIGLFLSCRGAEEPEVDTISMQDLMGESFDGLDSSSVVINDTIGTIPTSDFDKLTFSFLEMFDTLPLNVGHAFDRYGFSKSNKISFVERSNGADSLNILGVNLYQYYFSDSLKLNNAFYNWLDCFGDECSELIINQDDSGFSSKPQQIIIYDTIAVFTKFANSEVYLKHNTIMLDSITCHFGNDYRYKLKLNQKGELKW
jgi:hypothetical protein